MYVTALPRALAPWADKLALFPRDVALAMAPLLPRLQGVIGASGRAPGDIGEPDGYDGITRRGPYHRLLASEWLLLSEIPDEFLRRVASAEHSFLQVSRRPPEAGREGVVLLDAGPDQLGAPRVVHLAALIVLAARVEQDKGTLSWGVLQGDEAILQEGITRASVLDLLRGRSPRPVAGDDIDRWLGLARVASASERWLVGAEDLRPPAARRGTSALVVMETPEVGARRVHVTAHPAGPAGPRAASLDLPAVRACVQILRDPFAIAVSDRAVAPAVIDSTAGMVFSGNGRRLHLRGLKGELITAVVPNSPRMPVPAPVVFVPPEGQGVVAVGFDRERKRTIAVCAGRDSYFSHSLSKPGRTAHDSHEHRFAAGQLYDYDPTWGPLQSLSIDKHGKIGLLDAQYREFELSGSVASCVDETPCFSVEDQYNERTRIVLLTLGPDRGARVVALDPSRRRVELSEEGGRNETLFTAAASIHGIYAAEHRGLVGYLSDDGEVGVYSLGARAVVLKLAPRSLS